MIKVSSLNKYYNKGKDNEIHVINDVNFEFPEKGFITILGKSGSGKTTLLNVISGLDKMDSGTISYRQGLKVFDEYNMKRMDYFRIRNIGYIFQNYLILPEETVYENVDTSLKLCGIQDPKERKIRADAALKAVGMAKYRRKLCGALSGGQKQRVGIARAIAKMPKIIIADEPTGNLDSENSVEIMRILKDISKNYLVVMVTHNERLAWAFGDRVIKYKDGQIVEDVLNSEEQRTTYELGRPKAEDSILYLSDYQNLKIKELGITTDVYASDPKTINVNIKIIDRDGTKYLFVDDDSIIINDKTMSIKEKRPEVHQNEDFNRTSTFDSSNFTKVERKPVPFSTLLKQAFSNFFHEKRMRTGAFKILSAILGIGLAVVSIVTYFTFFTNEYSVAKRSIETDSVSLAYSTSNIGTMREFTADDFVYGFEHQEETGITGIVSSITINAYNFGYGAITGTSDTYASATIHMPQINGETPKTIYGTSPTGLNEIAVSTGAIDLAMPEFIKRGYNYDLLIGKNFYNNSGERIYFNAVDATPVITGIIKNSRPYIYLSREDAFMTFDALVTRHSYVENPFAYSSFAPFGRDNRPITFSLLDIMDFKLKEDVDYTYVDEGSLSSELINVYISSSAIKYFNYDFAVESALYNVVGTFESDNLEVVFYDNDDYKFYRYIEGIDSLYTTKIYSEIPNDIELVDGRLPSTAGEYLVSEISTYESPAIVGHYKTDDRNIGKIYQTLSSTFYNNYRNIKNLPGSYYGDTSVNFLKSYKISFYSNNVNKSNEYVKTLDSNYNVISTSKALNNANAETLQDDQKIILLIVLAAILVVMFAIVALATRSNMIRQIYTISVFRSLGASRFDIHKMFIAKDLVNFLLTMFAGVLSSYIFVWILYSILGLVLPPFYLFLICAIVAYALSLLGTMIPLWSLLRKTPTEITSKYDI